MTAILISLWKVLNHKVERGGGKKMPLFGLYLPPETDSQRGGEGKLLYLHDLGRGSGVWSWSSEKCIKKKPAPFQRLEKSQSHVKYDLSYKKKADNLSFRNVYGEKIVPSRPWWQVRWPSWRETAHFIYGPFSSNQEFLLWLMGSNQESLITDCQSSMRINIGVLG